MPSIIDLLRGNSQPQPFYNPQPQNPLDMLVQPASGDDPRIAAMLELANNKPRNVMEGIAGGLNSFAANRLRNQDQEKAMQRQQSLADLLMGNNGQMSPDAMMRAGVISNNPQLIAVAQYQQQQAMREEAARRQAEAQAFARQNTEADNARADAQFQWQQGNAEANRTQQLEMAQMAQKAKGPMLTPAQKSLDQAFAKDYADRINKGEAADTEKNIAQLESVIDTLSTKNVSGPVIGNTPDVILSVTNPDAINARDQVSEVVQRNLRVILGAQFTQREGEQLIQRAYNEKLDEATNKDRLQRLVAAMKQAASIREDADKYFETYGTLQGWQGRLPTIRDIETMMDDKAPVSNGAKGGWSVQEIQ